MERKRTTQGHIIQMQNFSVNDGEGIRTTIFMCGCPLNCVWCCNPENKYFDDEHILTTQEVVERLSRMSMFLKKGGGVTFSGGECVYQEEFLRDMVYTLYDKGYDLAMETCGYWNFNDVKDILEKMNMIFFDLKIMDTEQHRYYTGEGNELILENFSKLSTLGISVVVRIPTIKGVNASEENVRATCEFIKAANPNAKLEFLPYHRLGIDKYKKLGLDDPESKYDMSTPSDDEMGVLAATAEAMGVEVVSYK